MLRSSFTKNLMEAGCDEAGRGCLAGPVVAAAVIFPKKYRHKRLNDSKQLSREEREELRFEIERDALAWVAEGKSDWEISVILSLSETTVRFHVDNARKKLGAVNRAQAVARLAAARLL